MPDNNDGDVLDELRQLGENLKGLLRTTWDSEERRKFQKEMETGLADLRETLSKTASDITASPTGQALRSDLEQLQDRLHTGELEAQVRNEVLAALKLANQGLKQAAAHRPTQPPPPGETENPPDQQPPVD